MAFYYDRHPPAYRSNRRTPRRQTLSGVVGIHTAENAPDFVLPDTGAERVARFLADRTTAGSYHRVVDSDSVVAMMGWMEEAAGDGTGTNAHAVHLSFATQAHLWPTKPKWWRDGALNNMALVLTDFARYVLDHRGPAFVPPARWITGDQARDRVPGLVTHASLDPSRRSDPGPHFPRQELADIYSFFMVHNGIVQAPSKPAQSLPAPRIQVALQLSPGDRGAQVAELQSIVRFWQAPGLAVDGIFGDATAAAVRKFKETLRVGYHSPERVGDTPLWGLHTSEAYGWFRAVVAAL